MLVLVLQKTCPATRLAFGILVLDSERANKNGVRLSTVDLCKPLSLLLWYTRVYWHILVYDGLNRLFGCVGGYGGDDGICRGSLRSNHGVVAYSKLDHANNSLMCTCWHIKLTAPPVDKLLSVADSSQHPTCMLPDTALGICHHRGEALAKGEVLAMGQSRLVTLSTSSCPPRTCTCSHNGCEKPPRHRISCRAQSCSLNQNLQAFAQSSHES